MTTTISLVKEKAEKVTISLSKKGITKIPPLRVVADLDVSGSMVDLYASGAVERAFEKLLGLAFTFDDDGDIEVFAFDSNCYTLPVARAEDYGTYIQKNITKQWPRYGGGTNYSKALQANITSLFSAQTPASSGGGILGALGFGKKSPPVSDNAEKRAPALILFFTDGEPSDGYTAGAIIKHAQDTKQAVYFHLIGVGGADFRVLRRFADDYDNCGFINLASVSMSDEAMYDALATDEFVAWLRLHGAA